MISGGVRSPWRFLCRDATLISCADCGVRKRDMGPVPLGRSVAKDGAPKRSKRFSYSVKELSMAEDSPG